MTTKESQLAPFLQNAKGRSILDLLDGVDLISPIFDHMQDDVECPVRQTRYLIALYNQADIDGKRIIDSALICVCGYSLETLIRTEIVKSQSLTRNDLNDFKPLRGGGSRA